MSECDKNDPECIRLRQRFDRKYPYSGLEGLILKTSVSELKKAYLDMEMTAELFKDRNEEKRVESVYSVSEKTETDKPHALSGTDRGSAYHKVMELLDFTDNDIKSQINKFKNNGLILKEWGDAVSVDKIERFLSSDIGRRMAKAQQNGTLRREQPFMLGIDANRVQSSWPSNETVLLQGIIDAFFIEDGQIVLLDYKTDVIKNGEELMHRYSIQLDYYEEALNRILEMPVKESVLYSFCLGEAISRPAR